MDTQAFAHPQAMVQLPIHFGVEDHSLPFDVFVRTTDDLRTVIENFNQQLFAGQVVYDLAILPPEIGSFKSVIRVIALSVPVIWAGVNSDIGSGYIKGLTGKTSAEWAETLGHDTHEMFTDLEDARKKLASSLLLECSQGFLQHDLESLQGMGVAIAEFRNAYEARNDFYLTCAAYPEIYSVGFGDAFPIQSQDFSHLLVPLPPKPFDGPWMVETRELSIPSPDWKRGDRNWWKGKTAHNKTIFFTMEDHAFWEKVYHDQLHCDAVDHLSVQLAYRLHNDRMAEARVLRVLAYNQTRLSPLLADQELKEILKEYVHIKST